MPRASVLVFGLLVAVLGRAEGQAPTTADREAILRIATDHVTSMVSRERNREVTVPELVLSSREAGIEEIGARMGMRIGTSQEAVRCELPPDRSCASIDGAQAGFDFMDLAVDGQRASVVVNAWFLIGFDGEARLSGRADRLHLARGDGGWRLERVDGVAQREE
jgi:hypothetical protein